MKKRFGVISLISFLIVCGLLNLILFLTVPDERLSSGVFWLVWSFTFPFNLAVMVLVGVYLFKKEREASLLIPAAKTVMMAAFSVYVVIGAFLMYLPINSFVFPLILECVITGVYLIVLMTAFRGVDYVTGNREETRQKVQYIRLLGSDLESCFVNVTDSALKAKLDDLAEQIRFSDPMSHPSLSACEAELNVVIFQIVNAVNSGELDGIDADIKKAKGLLNFRNSRCAILK